ncbi:DUF881 domain-containing protein [Blastococcus saxobsidens]|uniref:DUF881 domain-containing protein n=1 Tax=Blastococcus saxobsidens (strain DD2) TaxID=1146883 RepID=H6RJC6_BLASD|nr:DUF881 domain-containing protein [Blastococcus saxobsidens]CCG01039.1 conserved exported protein of unknown function [Blastococcus saxobsidens DD2]
MPRSLLRGGRPSAWSALVPVVAVAAGLLFATSGRTAQGTDLRAGEVTELSQLIEEREAAVVRQAQQLGSLQERVQLLTEQAAARNGAVAEAQAIGATGAVPAGLVPVSGDGVVITLDDAPQRPDGSLPGNARADDLVIHQSDVQAVVNAVWAAGAEGVAVMDQRLVSTSAVRCVGNTLLLQGRTYSPPFVVTAVVDAAAVEAALDASPQVGIFEQAADAFGLTFEVRERSEVTVPAYDGGLTLQHAVAP